MPNSVVDVLLVEDTPSDVALSLHAFKKKGIADRVRVMRDGAEALDFLFCAGEYATRHTDNVPKVILLDLHLPKVDGLEVLRRIKAAPRIYNIPIVILVSSDQDPHIDRCHNLGANSHIVKPVNIEQFAVVASSLGLYWPQLNQGSASEQSDVSSE
jgi:two-component system, response regulator